MKSTAAYDGLRRRLGALGHTEVLSGGAFSQQAADIAASIGLYAVIGDCNSQLQVLTFNFYLASFIAVVRVLECE